MKRPLIVGLTGSIGMGKSTVARMFEDEGVPVFDADAEVRRLQGPDGALIAAIEAAFPGTTGRHGVDREALGALVFGNADHLARLEAIVHPAVARSREAFLETHADRAMVVFDIPLLFEKGGSERVDHIVVVSAPEDEQRRRVMARPGMTAQKLDAILGLQVPDANKRSRADSVIDTGQSLAGTRSDVAALVARLSSLRDE